MTNPPGSNHKYRLLASLSDSPAEGQHLDTAIPDRLDALYKGESGGIVPSRWFVRTAAPPNRKTDPGLFNKMGEEAL